VTDLLAKARTGPAKVRFKNLADVHAAWHTQRVEHDIHMRTVLQERHVFNRNDPGHDTLVSVTAGHLIARLHLALHGDEDLNHLHHARKHLVATLDLLDLV